MLGAVARGKEAENEGKKEKSRKKEKAQRTDNDSKTDMLSH